VKYGVKSLCILLTSPVDGWHHLHRLAFLFFLGFFFQISLSLIISKLSPVKPTPIYLSADQTVRCWCQRNEPGLTGVIKLAKALKTSLKTSCSGKGRE